LILGDNLPTFEKKSEMEISGKVVQVMQEINGQGKSGMWRKQEFVVQQPGQYPKNVCMTLWGDKIDRYALKEGMQVRAKVDVESREYNSKWYTDIKVWDLAVDGAADAGAPMPPTMDSSSAPFSGGTLPGAAPSPPAPPSNAPFEDDLPF
jgi:hypothetical protein